MNRMITVGQIATTKPPETAAEDTFTLSGTTAAFRKIGPSLFVVGIATGVAFAIGAAIANSLIARLTGSR